MITNFNIYLISYYRNIFYYDYDLAQHENCSNINEFNNF